MSGTNSAMNGGSINDRFQLLTSPVATSQKNVWELATDAMLRDIYGTEHGELSADLPAPSDFGSNHSWTSSSVAGDSRISETSSSPFDLVDLDIEIEEPFQLADGLDSASGYLNEVEPSNSMTWPSLLTSIVSAQ